MEAQMNADFERGQNAERTHMISDKMDRVEKDVTQLRAEVHEIKLTLARIEGGWKVAVGVAAVVGTIVGYLMRFLFDK